MADRDLRRIPHLTKGEPLWWWYEESGGMGIYHQMRSEDGRYLSTQSYIIPWKRIRPALARKDKK